MNAVSFESKVWNFITLCSLLEHLDSTVSGFASRLRHLSICPNATTHTLRSHTIRCSQSFLFLFGIQTAQDCRHFLRILLFFLILGPFRVLITILLGPVSVFLLNFETFDIVFVHDLLNTLVIVQNWQSWHLIKVAQVLLVTVTAAYKSVSRILQSVPFETSMLHSPRNSLIMGLFGPIWPLCVIESSTAEELSMKNLCLIVDMVFNLLLSFCIVASLVQRESVILDHPFWLGFVCGHEVFLVYFSQWLTKLVSNDVPIANLLVDGRIVDEGSTVKDGCLFLGKTSLLLFSLVAQTIFVRLTHNSVVHSLQILVRTVLAYISLTGRISNDIFICGHTDILSTIHGGATSEGWDASTGVWLSARPVHVAHVMAPLHSTILIASVILHLHV